MADPPIMKSFEVAADVAKQLITLSAAIIALTITFSKDFIGGVQGGERILVGVCWAVYVVSILGGVWLLYAISGSLSEIEHGNARSIYGKNTAVPMAMQQGAFLIAVIMTVVFGFIAL